VVGRVALPLTLVILAVGAWGLYYDWRLTGNPFTLYYSHWRAATSASEVVRGYQGSPPVSAFEKAFRLWIFYVGPMVSLAVLALIGRRCTRELGFCLGLFGVLVLVYFYSSRAAWPHYVAGGACLVTAAIVAGLRSLPRLRVGTRRWGAFAAGVMLVLYFVNAGVLIARLAGEGPQKGWMALRHQIPRRLSELEGGDVVLVRYGPHHSIHQEWVYNGAEIDSQDVVWARDLGPERNSDLIEYFGDRRIWQLDADERPVLLAPYVAPAETDTPAAQTPPGVGARADMP
jgi:hypothetical protein